MSDDLVKRLRDMNGGWASDEALAAADRIEELEAKLARALVALERLSTAELHGAGEALGMRLSEDPMGREILARMNYARTTIAELKGMTNDQSSQSRP